MTDELPDAKIRVTTVTPNVDGFFVEIQVSDGGVPTDESAAVPPPTVRLPVGVKIPASRLPTLASVQREAMHLAACVLAALVRDKDAEMRGGPGSG